MQPRCPITGVLLMITAGVTLTCGSGCSVLKLAAHRLHEEAVLRHSDKRIEKRTEKWAEEAFAQQYGGIPSCYENEHFHDGYVAGFKSHVLNGNSQLPVFPPKKYRKARYATPAGKYHIDTWFLGYQNGISAAVAGGYRELVVLRTPGSAGAQAPFPVGVGPQPLPPVLESPLGPPPLPYDEATSPFPSMPSGEEPSPQPHLSPVPPAAESPGVPDEESSRPMDPTGTPGSTGGAEPLRLPEIEQMSAEASSGDSASVRPANAERTEPATVSVELQPQPAAASPRPHPAATSPRRAAPSQPGPSSRSASTSRRPVVLQPTSTNWSDLPADLDEIVEKLRPKTAAPSPAPRAPRVEHVIVWETPGGDVRTSGTDAAAAGAAARENQATDANADSDASTREAGMSVGGWRSFGAMTDADALDRRDGMTGED